MITLNYPIHVNQFTACLCIEVISYKFIDPKILAVSYTEFQSNKHPCHKQHLHSVWSTFLLLPPFFPNVSKNVTTNISFIQSNKDSPLMTVFRLMPCRRKMSFVSFIIDFSGILLITAKYLVQSNLSKVVESNM